MSVLINGTTGISGVNGSAGTPSVQGEDTNTGVFFPAADTVGVATAGAERARIDASGAVLVRGTTYSGATTALNSFGILPDSSFSPRISFNHNFAGTKSHVLFYYNSTQVGVINTTTTATSYNTSSDYRLKENVQPMTGALDTIAQLNPVTYSWISDGSAGQGFIAHELQAVVPDCVTGAKDAVDAEGNPQYQGVDTSFLVATLVKAVQELKAEVDGLRAQLEAN